jgi:hypothetical protein
MEFGEVALNVFHMATHWSVVQYLEVTLCWCTYESKQQINDNFIRPINFDERRILFRYKFKN